MADASNPEKSATKAVAAAAYTLSPDGQRDLVARLFDVAPESVVAGMVSAWGGVRHDIKRELQVVIGEAVGLSASASEYDVDELIEALEESVEGFSPGQIERLLGLAGRDVFDEDLVAEAVAALRCGDLAGAERALIDACPSADRDADQHVGRQRMLFERRGRA